jgi:hypothetical protein
MWIASKLGFYSIVQKRPGEWHVRARLRADLVNLVNAVCREPAAVVETIEEWPTADYRWRILVTDAGELAGIFAALAESVTYPNFKSEVARRPDQTAKLPAYHDLWHSLHTLQLRPGPAAGNRRGGPTAGPGPDA